MIACVLLVFVSSIVESVANTHLAVRRRARLCAVSYVCVCVRAQRTWTVVIHCARRGVRRRLRSTSVERSTCALVRVRVCLCACPAARCCALTRGGPAGHPMERLVDIERVLVDAITGDAPVRPARAPPPPPPAYRAARAAAQVLRRRSRPSGRSPSPARVATQVRAARAQSCPPPPLRGLG